MGLQIKERIASMDIEELGESYPVECQRLYHNVNHFLSDDNRTLDSYGLSGSNIILHLGRSSKRRKITVTTTTATATNAVPAPNPDAVVETETLPARSLVDAVTASEVESPERPRRALISYRRADELFDHLQARMALLREMQNAQMMRRSQSQKLNVMVTRLLEGC